MGKKSGWALCRVTLLAMARRKGASCLLAAVAALGVFASIALYNLTARQEAAMADMVENTQIRCVVTDVQGVSSSNLQMFSAYVDMLTGLRHERGCYLDQYVRNVRAKADSLVVEPEGITLRRILSFDSDSALDPVEGAEVHLFQGWTEADFRGQGQICLIPAGMATGTGQQVDIQVREGIGLSLQVVGTVSGGPENVIWCPFYMPTQAGISEAFRVESCSFDIGDNARLDQCKAEIYQVFADPGQGQLGDGLTYGVVVQDETYTASMEEFQANLAMLRLLLPVLTVLCGGIGFFGGYLATRGRLTEFAVMRCLGMKRQRVFGLVFGEQLLLAVLGTVLGGTAGCLLEGALAAGAMGRAGLVLAAFLAGGAVAAVRVTRVNVMKLLKAAE